MHTSKSQRIAQIFALLAVMLGLLGPSGASAGSTSSSAESVRWGPPTLNLIGSASGTRVNLTWTTSYFNQSYAEVFRDGARLQRLTGFSTSLGMPDYNVHRYSVRSYQSGGMLGWYLERSINIGPAAATLPTPRPVYPLNGDLAPRGLTLRTDPIAGVSRYRFEVWNAANGQLVSRTDRPSTSWTVSLPANGRFRWRVAALSMNGNAVAAVGRFSDQINFTTRR